MYAVIRQTGIAWMVLGLYFGFALGSFCSFRVSPARYHVPLLLCRLLHIFVLRLNVIYSDELHNYDKIVGETYLTKDKVAAAKTSAIEQQLHATDWRAALAVPWSYHVLLIFGIIMQGDRLPAFEDALLFACNLAVFGVMCWRITPARITPKRELFLSFVLTFGLQMVCLLAAFWRLRATHPQWLPLWFVYAAGLVAKALEWPDSDVFGHHEVMHMTTILGHLYGLLIDVCSS